MKKSMHQYVALILCLVSACAEAATIDKLFTVPSGRGIQTYGEFGHGLMLLGTPDTYYLNDGSQWESGAGISSVVDTSLAHEQVIGSMIFYYLNAPNDGIALSYTDFNSGDHSSQGVLAFHDPLIVVAKLGGDSAYLAGHLRILSNDATDYGEPRFNFYSASVGSLVPFASVYSLTGGETWHRGIFNQQFSYDLVGAIDFRPAVPEPASALLAALGLMMCGVARRRITHSASGTVRTGFFQVGAT